MGITGYDEVRGLNEGKQSTLLRLKRAWRKLGKLVLMVSEFMTVVEQYAALGVSASNELMAQTLLKTYCNDIAAGWRVFTGQMLGKFEP